MMSAPAIQPAYRAEDEKRKYPRFRVNLEIELNIDGQAAPLRTHTSDVGLGGCYVEMLFTLPVGSRLDLTLWLGREKWRTRAEVVTRDPQFGNGIRFLNLEDDKRVRLGQFLDTLPPQQVTDNF